MTDGDNNSGVTINNNYNSNVIAIIGDKERNPSLKQLRSPLLSQTNQKEKS